MVWTPAIGGYRTQLYIPGPSKWFVSFDSGPGGDPWASTGSGYPSGWNLFGWCEQGCQLSMIAAYEDVVGEPSGPMVPQDTQFFGEAAFFSGTFLRYNEEILQCILNRRGLLTPGGDNYGDWGLVSTQGVLGGLMLQDNLCYSLCIVSMNPTFLAANNVLSRQPPAHTFWNCWLHDNQDTELGMRAKRPRTTFRAISRIDEGQNSYSFYMPDVPGGNYSLFYNAMFGPTAVAQSGSSSSTANVNTKSSPLTTRGGSATFDNLNN